MKIFKTLYSNEVIRKLKDNIKKGVSILLVCMSFIPFCTNISVKGLDFWYFLLNEGCYDKIDKKLPKQLRIKEVKEGSKNRVVKFAPFKKKVLEIVKEVFDAISMGGLKCKGLVDQKPTYSGECEDMYFKLVTVILYFRKHVGAHKRWPFFCQKIKRRIYKLDPIKHKKVICNILEEEIMKYINDIRKKERDNVTSPSVYRKEIAMLQILRAVLKYDTINPKTPSLPIEIKVLKDDAEKVYCSCYFNTFDQAINEYDHDSPLPSYGAPLRYSEDSESIDLF